MQGTVAEICAKLGTFTRGRGLVGRGSFALKLMAVLAVIIGADIIFWQKQWLGSGFGLFGALLLLMVFTVRGGIKSHIPAIITALVAFFYAGAMAYDPSLLACVLFLITITILALLPGAAKGGDGWQWFQRFFIHGLRSIIAPLLDLVKWKQLKRKLYARRGARGIQPRSALRHISTLILPIVGSLVFIALFAAANPVIAEMLATLRWPTIDLLIIPRAIIWGVIFWMSWSLLRPKLLRNVAGTFEGRGDVHIPGVTLQSLKLSLGLFNIIFAVQNMMDITYLGGFAPLPKGMSLAEYAHRGAYPLIATALLAGLFTLITLRPGSTSARDPLIRRLLVLWIVQNIFLVASSMERTLDYVRIFSLTEWRIAALAWMLLVAVGLALICWRMLKDKNASWLINGNLFAAGVMLSIFTVVDTGAISAQWNVRHAKEVGGEGTHLDLCYLADIGAPALLPLVELEQRSGLTTEFRERVKVARTRIQADVTESQYDYDWTVRNAQRLAAAESQIGTVRKDARMHDYECDGSKSPPPPVYPELPPLSEQTPAPTPNSDAVKSSLPSSSPSPSSPSHQERQRDNANR